MQVVNELMPTDPERVREMMAPGPKKPIYMVNLPKFGGRGMFAADVTSLSLWKVEELWDEVAIATYPNRRAMVEMSMSKEWREISVHREAGLKGQLNIETVLQEGVFDGLIS